jgi:predicted dehydrogenase
MFLSPAAADALMQAPQAATRAPTPRSLRDTLALELLYGAGLRVSELAFLNLGDVSLARREIRVLGKGRKERAVPLGSVAARACEQYLEDPRFAESHRLASFGPRGTDVAVVLDLMIHDIDLLLGLVRRPVESVDAVGVGVLTGNVDIANARLVFEGGAVANITASRVSMERMRKIRFFQRSGYLSLDLATGTGEFLRVKEGATLPEGDLSLLSLMSVVERIELKGDGAEPLRAELEAWIAAVRGEGPLVVSGRDGRDALAVALRIMEKIEDHAVAVAGAA